MKAILWDMDGTLVDTEPLWGVATYEMSRAMGRELTEEVRALTVGGTTENTVRICADHAEMTLTNTDVQQWLNFMWERVAGLMSSELSWRPGAKELLVEAKKAGISMALVTNTKRELTDIALESIGTGWFEFTLCGDEVPRGKPAPDIYLTAAHKFGIQPDDCLVLEDSVTGMTAGRDAGARVLGIPATSGDAVADGVASLRELTADGNVVEGHPNLGQVTLAELHRFYNRLGTYP